MRCSRHLSGHAARHSTRSALIDVGFFPAQQAPPEPTFGWRRSVNWHRLGTIGLLPGTRPRDLAVRLRIYCGVSLTHDSGDAAVRPTQRRVHLIFSDRKPVDLDAAMTGPAQTV